MRYTISEKILAAKCDREAVHAGEFINAQVDLLVVSNVSGVMAIEEYKKISKADYFDPSKVVFSMDHYTLAMDDKSVALRRKLLDFTSEHTATYFDVSQSGTPLLLLPELGMILPGDLIAGSDSHTCSFGFLGALGLGMGASDVAAAMALGELWLQVPESIKVVFHGELPKWVGGKDLILHLIGQIGAAGALYKVIEFSGEVVDNLSLSGRYTVANMAVEAGAKSCLFSPDIVVRDYLAEHKPNLAEFLYSDPDADYAAVHEFDVSGLEPLISTPHSPENVTSLSEIADLEIDQVIIGLSSTGTLEDLRAAAEILKDRLTHSSVRTVIIPGTQQIYLEAVREGLIEIFLQANCAVSPPTSGGCMGGHFGVLAEGERCVVTGNQNFQGLLGHPDSEVYLSNSYVAAASAVAGKIASPEEVEG
jgi:3-isopropylmalate/(R)-2-methylmalate dehydratase large subunit